MPHDPENECTESFDDERFYALGVETLRVFVTFCAVVLGFVLPLFLIDEHEIDEMTGAYGPVGGILLVIGYVVRRRYLGRATGTADVLVRAGVAGLLLGGVGVALIVVLELAAADADWVMPAAVLFPALAAGRAVFSALYRYYPDWRTGLDWRRSFALLATFTVVAGSLALAGAIGHAVSYQ